MKSLPSRRLATLLAIPTLSLTSCGEPSPWGNIIGPDHDALTTAAIHRLGQPDDELRPFSVGLIADPQVYPGFLRAASGALDDRDDIAFSIILGDLTDRSLRTEFMWAAAVVEAARHPIVTVVGNHDGLIYGEKIYTEVFGDLNYSFVFRGMKFVLWNNNPFEWGYPDFDWLRAEIDGYPRVIIAAHQPPGAIERFPEANDELRALYSHPHVLGSVHGHTHNFGFEQIAAKPVMTVGRVVDTTYAIMHVGDGGTLTFDRCEEDQCVPQD